MRGKREHPCTDLGGAHEQEEAIGKKRTPSSRHRDQKERMLFRGDTPRSEPRGTSRLKSFLECKVAGGERPVYLRKERCDPHERIVKVLAEDRPRLRT